ncbi:serine/threonine-protein kinase M1 [Nowakowskiella sp. JEL0078]|nr:serine/threonine-protein kinase M1 [Nowakowskiella sp. JEL0078]
MDSFRASAYEMVCRIANKKNISVGNLFLPYLDALSIYIIHNSNLHIIFQENLCETLFGKSAKKFLDDTLKNVLPHVVLACDNEKLSFISKIVERDISEMILYNIDYILAHLYLQENINHDAFSFCVKHASVRYKGVNEASLVHSTTVRIVTLISLEFGNQDIVKKRQAIKALDLIRSKIVGSESVSKNIQIEEFNPDRAEYLAKYALGILSQITSYLTDEIITAGDKAKMVDCVRELILQMGEQASSVSLQIMAVLQTTLNIEFLRDEALRALDSFVRTLKLQNIKPILNQLTVLLMKYYNDCHKSQQTLVISILEYLIVDNVNAFSSVFNQICSLPNLPELKQINDFLSSIKGISFSQRMSALLRNVKNENVSVSYQSLKELQHVLRENQLVLNELILRDDPDPIIETIVKCLLETCKNYSERFDIQSACVQCLGIIGATDPARLKSIDSKFKKATMFLDDSSTEKDIIIFVCHLLEKYLVPAFLNASFTHAQNLSAFSIRELLQICGFTKEIAEHESTSNQNGVSIQNSTDFLVKKWSRFPKRIKEAILPLIESKYSINALKYSITRPIYSRCDNFRDWVQEWTSYLIQENTDKKRALQMLNDVFAVFLQLIKKIDLNISTFLLPHLVLITIICGTKTERNELLEDFLDVLNDNSSDTKSQEKRRLSTQMIFEFVDHLTKWLLAMRQSRLLKSKRSTGVPKPEKSCLTVEKFLSSLPQETMANAALRCNDFTRALKHFELHLRDCEEQDQKKRVNQPTKQNNNEAMQVLYGKLQKIYANIDEPDGMKGIAKKLISPTVEQLILEYKANGNIISANSCFESSLQQTPNDLQLHVEYISFLKDFSQLDNLLNHVSGALSFHPEWENSLTPYGIDASWKLCKWDVLDDFLDKPHTPTFESDFGSLLSTLHHDNKEKFDMNLSNIRRELTTKVTEALLESYGRAHEHIVKLHLLEEVEMVFDILQKNDDEFIGEKSISEKLSNLLTCWESRLKITIPAFRTRELILNLRSILLQEVLYV